jgi:hypothetical protein
MPNIMVPALVRGGRASEHSAVSLSRGIGAGRPFEFDIKRTFSAVKVRPYGIYDRVERRDLPRLGRLAVDYP